MSEHLKSEVSPLDANLEKVLPGLKQWHNINEATMKKLEAEVQQLDSNVSQRMQCVIEEARAERSLADERLALAFRRFASEYDGSASTSVPKTSPDLDQFYDVTMPAHLTMNES